MKNNKGFTVAEVAITLSMLMIIMLSMMAVITHLKTTNKNNNDIKEISYYKSIISRKINDDFIMLKLQGVEDCSNNYEDYIYCYSFTFENNESDQPKLLIIDTSNNIIKYDGVKYKPISNVTIRNINSSTADNIFSLSLDLKYNEKTYNMKIVYPM